MIELTTLQHHKVFVNFELIIKVEAIPDTKITFTNGAQMTVKETPNEVTRLIREEKSRFAVRPKVMAEGAA